MSNKICGVYKITNIANGKIYIGSSKDIKDRWYQHTSKLNSKNHGNIHLQNAWNKYGGEKFKFEIIEECAPEFQFEREQFYLNTLSPFDTKGYNIVRQISKEYMSDNYMVKKCEKCGNEYNTFSHLSKYCDKCRIAIKNATSDWYKTWVDEKIVSSDVISWGYEDLDDFWECCI